MHKDIICVFSYLREIQNILIELCYHVILSYYATIYYTKEKLSNASTGVAHKPHSK